MVMGLTRGCGKTSRRSSAGKQGAVRGDRSWCGARSGPITRRMIAYRGVLLGLAGKMFQGRPQGVMSRAASVNCFFGNRGKHSGAGGVKRWTVENELRP